MDETIKSDWLAALRGGKYKQTKFCLHKGESYCVLGVLADISGVGRWQKYSGLDHYHYKVGLQEDPITLPNMARKFFRLGPTACKALQDMNDGGSRFKELANYIERNL